MDTDGSATSSHADNSRANMPETLSTLAATAGVPARVSNEAAFQASKATATLQGNRQVVAAAVGALCAVTIVIGVLRQRRSRRFRR